MHAHRRKPVRQPPRRSIGRRDYLGVAIVILMVGGIIWYQLRPAARNPPGPVAAHSTPLIRGRCAVDRGTGLVWGRIVRLGTARGNMGVYTIHTLPERRLTEVSVANVRVVRCEEVTGPRALEYDARTP